MISLNHDLFSPRCYNAAMPGHKKSYVSFLLITILVVLSCAACITETQEAPVDVTPSATNRPTLSAIETVEPSQGVDAITIWVPTFLAPSDDTLEGKLFLERLNAYEELNPGISIQIRVKDESGPAGLLETLSAANAAAPSALPDIVAFNPSSLNSAALKSMVVPLNDISEPLTQPRWYQYAIESVFIGESFFGIPFISDTDVFAYRKDTFESPPLAWGDLLSGTESFIFPGGDKGAHFTLAQYISKGGEVRDEDGHPNLSLNTLSEILEFYSTSESAGLLPLSALQYVSSNETWEVLQQIGVSSAVIPLQTYLKQSTGIMYIAQPLPTSDGDGIVLTRSYAWSIVDSDAENQTQALNLINWLLEPEFLGPWANMLGMLPATSEAISHWPNDDSVAVVNQLVRVAVPMPSDEIVTSLGPALQLAIEEVLFTRSTPNAAARMAVNQVVNP